MNEENEIFKRQEFLLFVWPVHAKHLRCQATHLGEFNTPHLASVARFPALRTSCIFSRAWQQLHIFPRLAAVAHFPAVGSSCMFSRAWYRAWYRLVSVAFFPPLAPVTGFVTGGTVFPLLLSARHFPALSTGCPFSSA